VTQSHEHDVIWLTQEAFDKLQDELEQLRGPVRDEIVARISAARDEGDLKENGGYHAAREEQGKTEARTCRSTPRSPRWGPRSSAASAATPSTSRRRTASS
jgi:hypothetical protein